MKDKRKQFDKYVNEFYKAKEDADWVETHICQDILLQLALELVIEKHPEALELAQKALDIDNEDTERWYS